MKKILFTGGGSAGHVIPNIALMEELLKSGNVDVGYMGTDGIEKEIITGQKIPYYQIECPKLIRGGGFHGLKRNLKIPFAFSRAVKNAKTGLNAFQPDLVFSKGGYVALPVVFAARKLNIPCFAHESDFSAGLSNRLSARKCERVFTSFPETAEKIPHGKYSGPPIRASILSAHRAKARQQLNIPFSDKVLLVFGGGSGSAAINDAVRKNLKTLTEKYTILHVCGKGNVLQSNVKNYIQTEFVTDMGAAYAAADLVLARAGAGTVFEILATKKPSLLVPLSGQTRGDQKQNADYFKRRGLCRVLPQNRLHELPKAIDEAFEDKRMVSNLYETRFAEGNENILREIKKRLGI
ncbi:MAG: UDP-N-acetylglucosamine--N-acetylmuramyl-(pentapeptide) pyrophosphoryl-undecaprenol N-acetylglucosamine transferase [Clostridia bacterium]|nr:UDP-N-acetylglucosamine--N-acetylmuramyl-(pentapeptide) pyrophosphoryl-undecaprenol N-acetylglucosamine transferase [Clostridia bacterium]